jgi:hypothetical protein
LASANRQIVVEAPFHYTRTLLHHSLRFAVTYEVQSDLA